MTTTQQSLSSQNPKLAYYIKRPNAKRKTYAIYSQALNPDGSTVNVTLDNSDVNAVNEQLQMGKINHHAAEKMIVGIKARLSQKPVPIFNNDNNQILDKVMEEYFQSKPFIICRESTINKYRRAVRCLGNLSVMAVTRDEALQCVLKLKTNSRQREAANKLNSLFKKLRRDIIIPVVPKQHDELMYVSEDELTKIVASIDNPIIAAAVSLSFYSGLRIGELRSLTQASKIGINTLNVLTQIDREGEKRLPKNRKKRKAFIHEKGVPAFELWIAKETEFSHKQMTYVFKAACYKLFKKRLKWHDLRHSYAVHMISSGVPIQLVAQSMGNSVKVCEDYYSGHVLSDHGIDTISRMLLK